MFARLTAWDRRGSPSVGRFGLLSTCGACVATDLNAVAIRGLTDEHVVVAGSNEDVLALRVATVGAIQGGGLGICHRVLDILGTIGAALREASWRPTALAGRTETRPHESDRPTRRITIVRRNSTLAHPAFARLDHDARFTVGAHCSTSTL
jgi:hypothetical protein